MPTIQLCFEFFRCRVDVLQSQCSRSTISIAVFCLQSLICLLVILPIRSLQILRSSAYQFAVLCSLLWLMFLLYVFWGRRSFIDPICCNSYMVLYMFQRFILANPLFSLPNINLTLGLLPPRRHVVWRDSVGVEGSRSGLKSACADIFHQSFLWLLRHTDEPQRGRNSCLWLQSRSELSSFGVVLMSCRVNFHVVRSTLQYSACRI